MIMLQNNVIMRALCEFAHTIRDFFSSGSDFELTAWSNFFRCAITFIKQPSLQLEKFSENKKLKILNMVVSIYKFLNCLPFCINFHPLQNTSILILESCRGAKSYLKSAFIIVHTVNSGSEMVMVEKIYIGLLS